MTDWILYILLALFVTYTAGIVLKRRFSARARIYAFEAYDSESGELRPARGIRRYRLYHRLFDHKRLPRITSWISLLPFVPNRISVHGAILYARAYIWDKNRAIAVKSESKKAVCMYLPQFDGSLPDGDTVIPRESLSLLGESGGTYLFTEGSVFVLCEGSRYIFFYYVSKK